MKYHKGTSLCVLIILTMLFSRCTGPAGSSEADSDGGATAPITTVPEAPTGLNASDGTHEAFVRLSWNASTGANGYRIFWAPAAAGPYTEFDTTSATVFDDYDGGDGTTYYFKVTAYNGFGESGFRPDDPDLYLFSSRGNELARSRDSSGLDELIRYTAPCSGYYYFRVNNWLGDSFDFDIGFYKE